METQLESNRIINKVIISAVKLHSIYHSKLIQLDCDSRVDGTSLNDDGCYDLLNYNICRKYG